MRVLVVCNMYPKQDLPSFGIFVAEQVESLRREGVEIDVLFIDGWNNKLNYLSGLFRFWKRILTNHYDLIHAHYVFSGIIARMQFLYPVVLTHHGIEAFTSWQRFPSRLITSMVDKTIVVSPEQKKNGYKSAEIIPCGVDFDLFKPFSREEARKELKLPSDKKLVLWAGQYTRPEKRFDIVQATISILQKEDPDIELVLVSDQPHQMMPLYMNACDVLFLVSNGEGSPMVIKEAMACNLPIVSVPCGDVSEVIGDTEGCYICTQNPVDVAEKIRMALGDGRRTEGREKIRHMELSHISRKILAEYRKVAHKKRAHFLPWAK